MNTNPAQSPKSKKSLFIGLIIGLIIAFSAFYFYQKADTADYNEQPEVAVNEEMNEATANEEMNEATANEAVKNTENATDQKAAFLMNILFSDLESQRKFAKNSLAKEFNSNTQVMAAMIEKCSTEFDKKDRNDNGIFQSIDVFLMVAIEKPETLRANKDILYAFFEKTKGQYRDKTQAKIEEVKRLLEQ